MATAKQLPRQVTLILPGVRIPLLTDCCNRNTCNMQALQVLESLIVKDSDKLDIRDKQSVSFSKLSSCMCTCQLLCYSCQ